MHFEELLKLQSLDHELDQIKNEQGEYPDQLETVKNQYDTLLNELESLSTEFENTKKECSEMQEKLNLENTRLSKSKVRINEIKNNFEFQALKREIDLTEKSNLTLQKNIDESNKSLKSIEEKLNEKKSNLEQVETEFDSLKSLLDEKNDHYGEQIAQKKSEIEKYYEHIDKQLLHKYKFIRTRLEEAVVKVEEGVCYGCHMSLPPQMLNEMCSKKDLYNCPNCHRILFLNSYVEEA